MWVCRTFVDIVNSYLVVPAAQMPANETRTENDVRWNWCDDAMWLQNMHSAIDLDQESFLYDTDKKLEWAQSWSEHNTKHSLYWRQFFVCVAFVSRLVLELVGYSVALLKLI